MIGRCALGQAAILTTLAIAALAGCGGGEDPSGPATVVPAGVPVYADAVVDPGDDDIEAIQGSLGELLAVDVEAQVEAALDDLAGGEGLGYRNDVEPWLGERAAIFLLDLDGEMDGATVLEVDDADAAAESLESFARGELDDDGRAQLVGDYAVIGSTAGVEAAVAAAEGDALGDSEAFEDAVGPLDDERLTTVYVDPPAVLDGLAAEGAIDASDRAVVEGLLGEAGGSPLAIGAGAGEGRMTAELSHAGAALEPGGLLDRVPERAWLALALGDAGGRLSEALAAVGSFAGDDLDAVAEAIGFDIASLAAATGDAAAWLGGESVLGISGAIVLAVSDTEQAALVLDRLRSRLATDSAVRIEPLSGIDADAGFTLLPADVPIRFPFALRGDLLVAALGVEAADQALDPSTSLTEADSFDAAVDGLEGADPIAYIDFAAMTRLLDGLPGFWDDPEMAEARPYLERLDHLVAGATEDGGRSLLRVVLAVGDGDRD